MNSGLFWLAVRRAAPPCSLLEMWRQIRTSRPTANHWQGINARHTLEATPAILRKQSCLQTKSQRGENPATTQFIQLLLTKQIVFTYIIIIILFTYIIIVTLQI